MHLTGAPQRYVLGDEDLTDRNAHGPRPDAGASLPAADADRPVVLAAVDDDALAEAVVETAAALADRLRLRLELVHSPSPDLFMTNEKQRAALERGHALLERVAARHPSARRIVQTGEPATLVRSIADDMTAFIVVGTRGRGPLSSALLGSVSHAIARYATSPVVIVSAEATDSRLAREAHAPQAA